MYKTKQLISLILVLAMCLSLGTTAFATEISTAGSSAETPVVLNVEAALFSVTIPTGLPVDVAASGAVTVATDAKIINNSHGPVQVVNMTIESVEGWTIANYDEDLKNALVDSNQISMIINELKTTGPDAIEFSVDNFTVMLAKNDDTTDECPIVYNAKVTPLSEAFATDTVANLVFTVDWYKAEGSATETVTTIPVTATDSEGNNLNATSTDIIGTEKEDLLAKLEESGLVTSADDVDALIEVESDDFDNIANATFDVSDIAQEGDKVVILHFDETTQQWEYVTEETVDAEGKISADFTSFSPVAFVVVKEDGSMEIVTPEETSNLIPEGGTYYIGVTSTTCGDHTGATDTLTVGDEFPETVADGDVYVYGDYEYRYNQYYNVSSLNSKWATFTTQNGWGVRVLDDTKTAYGEILAEINGAPVTSLYNTFKNCTSLTTAPVIPTSVTNMASTFSGCTSLTTAPIIPDSVTNMYCTFYNCKLLTIAPDMSNSSSVTSMSSTFKYCQSLTTAPVIPNSVTNMNNTFYGCTNLNTYAGSTDADGDFSNYVIPNGVTELEKTFENCTSLTTAPEIPSSVTSMLQTFNNCTSLTTAPVIPKNVTNMSYTFSDCTNLVTYEGSTDADGGFSNYVIPSSVTNMAGTFSGCTSLTTAPEIPSGVTDMSHTFDGCTVLTTAPEIPESVTSMDGTFFDCKSLTVAPTLPSGLKTLYGIFYNCTNLKTYVGSTDADGDFSNYVIPEDVTEMERTFENCTSLTTAPIIPSSVTDMWQTFSGCTSLTTAPVIPEGVTNLERTFYNCTSLTAAPVIPSSVTDMLSTFDSCTALEGSITINANPNSYYNCFYNVDFAAQNLTLTGDSTMLAELGATGTNYQG